MSDIPRVTLEQWRTLQAIVDSGGYAQAAETLNKSQSAVSYAMRRLEQQLGVPVLEVQGRRAVLTTAGHTLLRRSRALLGEALAMEQCASTMAAGWESEVRLALDVIFPDELLVQVLAGFAAEGRGSRLELHETVLAGAEESLLERRVDLAVTGRVPAGFLGEPLLRVTFVAVAHPDHALHRLGRPLELQDLTAHRQIAIRDSSRSHNRDSGWLGAEQRWTVSQLTTSIRLIANGMGFAWLPAGKICRELTEGNLRPLPLRHGGQRFSQLYRVFADPDRAGPATRLIAERLAEAAGTYQDPELR